MTFQLNPVTITRIDNDLIRYVHAERRNLPGLVPRFTWEAAKSPVLREIAAQVIALPVASLDLDAVRARVADDGFYSDEVADVLNWLAEQPILVGATVRKLRLPRCRRWKRALTDHASIARGIGPECAVLEHRRASNNVALRRR